MKTKKSKFSVLITNLVTQKTYPAQVLCFEQEQRRGGSNPEKRLRIEVVGGGANPAKFFGPWMATGKSMRQNMVFSAETASIIIEFAKQTSEPLKMALAQEFERETQSKPKPNPRKRVAPTEIAPTTSTKKRRCGGTNPILNANVHFQDGHVVAQVNFDGVFVAVKKWLEGFFWAE